MFDEKIGKRISRELKHLKLKSGAIPSQLPNASSYLSKQYEIPCSSKSDRLQKKEDLIAKAIEQSKEDEKGRQEQDACRCLTDIKAKFVPTSPWIVRPIDDNPKEVTVCILSKFDKMGPQIKSAILIQEDLSLNVYIDSVKLTQLEDKKLPLKLENISTINQVCEGITKVNSLDEAVETSGESDLDALCIFYIKFIPSLLCLFKTEKCSFCSFVSFVYEQLELLTKKKKSFSNDYLIFSSIFYNLFPRGYRFVRSSGKITLPCYTTIRRLTISSSMDPFQEQHDSTFLFYAKQKFKVLLSCDKTVSLLVDEIHLKPYFDYKGGNNAGAAYNSEQPANSAFVFMITSLFWSLKDVVYIIPSTKMKSEVLYRLTLKTITGLETIGFRVISVITDNNAINSKAMSLFLSPPKNLLFIHIPATILVLCFLFWILSTFRNA